MFWRVILLTRVESFVPCIGNFYPIRRRGNEIRVLSQMHGRPGEFSQSHLKAIFYIILDVLRALVFCSWTKHWAELFCSHCRPIRLTRKADREINVSFFTWPTCEKFASFYHLGREFLGSRSKCILHVGGFREEREREVSCFCQKENLWQKGEV